MVRILYLVNFAARGKERSLRAEDAVRDRHRALPPLRRTAARDREHPRAGVDRTHPRPSRTTRCGARAPALLVRLACSAAALAAVKPLRLGSPASLCPSRGRASLRLVISACSDCRTPNPATNVWRFERRRCALHLRLASEPRAGPPADMTGHNPLFVPTSAALRPQPSFEEGDSSRSLVRGVASSTE